MNCLLTLELFACVFTLIYVNAAEGFSYEELDTEFSEAESEANFNRILELKKQGFEDLENEEELSPEDEKMQLGKLIDKSDTNKDDFLTRYELLQWFIRKSVSEDDRETKQLFKHFDKNKDGQLDWHEYAQEYEQGDHMKDIDGSNMATDILKDDILKFHAADRNNNRMLTLKEFDAFLHEHNFKHMHSVAVDLKLKEKDMNDNGFIDMNEYMMFANFADHDNPDAAARNVFDKYDLDKNGRLDRSEIRAWAAPTRREMASDSTNRLMSETDTDRDGKLTKKEIFGKHKLWVNTLAGDEI